MKKIKLLILALLLLYTTFLIKGQAPVYIDNFKPYVEKVIIESGAGNGIYEQYWELDPATQNKLVLPGPCMNAAADGVNNVSIIINMSESMADATIAIAGIAPADITFGRNGSDKQWKAEIPAGIINAMKTPGAITVHAITIDGHDLAGNSIQGFAPGQNEIPLATLNTRDNTGNWMPGTVLSPDTKHELRIVGGNKKAAYTNCLYVNFSATTTTVRDDETVTFINETLEESLVESWLWEFDGGTPSTSDKLVPEAISYVNAAPGTYRVKLTATYSGNIIYPVTKEGFITVSQKSEAFDAEIDFSYNPEKNIFSGITTGNVSSWHWDFSSGATPSPSDQKDAITHTFSLIELYHWAKLTVSYSDGSTKTKTQRIYNCGYPYTE